MCPDRQIISLYFDNELPSPWKEKMEAHLLSCPKCQEELSRYNQLGISLKSLHEENMQAAQERVWKKLSTPKEYSNEVHNNTFYRTKKGFWNRSINLPIPVAAAALLAIAFTLVFTVMRTQNHNQDAVALAADSLTPIAQQWSSTVLEDDLVTIFPAMDMDFFLQQLIEQNEGDFVIVRLPENSRFSRTGQPTLVNAADYPRRRGHR